jgi:predicted unusual protein kinase regulating ubiquinone biosynthesis (AarF/ABC1/UbiB family)
MRPAEQVGPAAREIERQARGDLVPMRGGAEPAPELGTVRPPARAWRFFKAYWVTFLVIGSYLSLKLQAKFRSDESIARILRRKHLRNARRIERAIIDLQGLYIKVGQLISIMTNFLPPEFRKQLEGLQDQVPPRPYVDIEARIREEFGGRSPDELFASFERRPLASASIGQVHAAELATGERVAVKVQYPDIEAIVRSDLRTLRRIFRIVTWFVPYDGLEEVYEEIAEMILEELDFCSEAANVDQIAANFRDREDVVFPRVVSELTTSRVLTTHFEPGTKVGDIATLDAMGVDRKQLASLVVESYCQQIFTDGVYHADPHPGNLLVRRQENGELSIVFLDFGAVAEISPDMRQGLIELIQGALARDTARITGALRQMGFVARGADDQVFERVIEYFHEKFQEQISLDSFNLNDIKFDPEKGLENLADLRKMDISIRELTSSFHVPKEWILLERTLLLLMGLCTALDPTMNPMAVIRPYLERFVLGEGGDWQKFVVETTKNAVLSIASLPSEMRKFMQAARAGDLRVRFHNLDRTSRMMYRLGTQGIIAAVGITGACIAIVLEGRGEVTRAEWAWWVAKGAGLLLVWSWWMTRRMLGRRR